MSWAWDEYLTLLDEFDEAGMPGWVEHREQLLARRDRPFKRLTQAELHAFWRNRFTDREIFEMAGALEDILT